MPRTYGQGTYGEGIYGVIAEKNQPILANEIAFSDPEFAYIEESPPGLYPENQDSNFGLFRKLFTDQVQVLISQQSSIYNERFVDSSVDFIDEWEREVGLPVAPTGSTLAQRRQFVLNRLRKGPFTRARRREIVESFINATFGPPVELGVAGVAIDPAGIPLYAEAASLSTLYSIRENGPYGRNILPNGNFETNISGWLSDVTMTGMIRSTTTAKWGLSALAGVAANTAPYFYPGGTMSFAATPGLYYTGSAWYLAPRSLSLYSTMQFFNSSGVQIGANYQTGITYTVGEKWKRGEITAQAPAGTAFVRPVFQFVGAVVGDSLYLDGAMLEVHPTAQVASDFVDTEKTPFYYEVRLKDTITPDMVGLTRELSRITPSGISFDALQVADV